MCKITLTHELLLYMWSRRSGHHRPHHRSVRLDLNPDSDNSFDPEQLASFLGFQFLHLSN